MHELPLLSQTRLILERGMAERLHSGVQIYVSLQGKLAADFALGEADRGQSMHRETLMPWLSSGKPITAVAIARLWERGLLELDQAVSSLIPEFGVQGKESISIRHLLTHTAGFHAADKIPQDIPWSEMIARICESPLEAKWIPGQRAAYQASSSWYILGEIVRRLDGRPLDRYAREEIFLPLEMNDSWLALSPEEYRTCKSGIGTIHSGDGLGAKSAVEPDPEVMLCRCRPGSSALGPIRELGRFYEMLLKEGEWGGYRFLKARTIKALCQRQRVGLFDETFRHKLDFGLGFVVNSNRYGAETIPYGYGRHASEETFGHSGAQSSCAFADPVHQLVVAWVCNAQPGERRHQRRAREINSAIYEDLRLGWER